MQVNATDTFGSGTGLTVTEAARRAQIIDATIATVAELGYSKASFAKIVERAGLSSTRMISYHFGTKSDLMLATVGQIVDNQDTFLMARLGDQTGRREMLRGYIESEIAFVGAYPQQAQALMEIGANARDGNATPLLDEVWKAIRIGRLGRQLVQGQREGAFGQFAVDVMAQTIRQALDGVPARLAHQPDLDLATYGRELADLFDRATRPVAD
ncbi:TetR/AcrR family transcriptional regulator [Saccharomonospora sp. NPDC046836]|uniref:TetR/AcrR family transcriptional regulator n=1 Tax=Saccharomonospora sp. NPDC046836 TaxID=3156921 RepID=UPI00341047B9